MTAARDIAREAQANDWYLTATGDLATLGTGDLSSISQHIAFRLRQRVGAWFLNLNDGWWSLDLFGKAPKLQVIRALIRATILQTPGVVAVESLDLDFDKVTRTLTALFTASTDLGLLQDQEVTL
jgi:hypothetical protein